MIVGQLLALGARYTISVAAAVGDQRQVEKLLKKNAVLATRLDTSRVSPLSYAAREGYSHIVELLLQHGADLNMPEDRAPDGRALFEACGGDHSEVAEILLGHGANPNAGVDSSGCCLTIVEYHHPRTCKPLQNLLRTHGASTPPDKMTTKELKKALQDKDAMIHDEEFLANIIGRNNADLFDLYIASDESELSHIHVYGGITYPKSPALIRKLLSHGLDPNRPDWLGRTYLHACSENADRAAASIFLDAGAAIDARDIEFKGTPLAAAVRDGDACEPDQLPSREQHRKRMVKFLLERGAAMNLPGDPAWATPLAWARKKGRTEIEAILRECGATH